MILKNKQTANFLFKIDIINAKTNEERTKGYGSKKKVSRGNEEIKTR